MAKKRKVVHQLHCPHCEHKLDVFVEWEEDVGQEVCLSDLAAGWEMRYDDGKPIVHFHRPAKAVDDG